MRLDEFLKTLGSEEERARSRLNAFSASSSKRRQLLENLFLEPRLSERAWDSLCQSLLKGKPDADAAEAAIIRFCRDHPLWGESARVGEEVTLGRVVSQEWLIGVLREQGIHIDVAEARAELQALIGMEPEDLPETWRMIPMGGYILWSTFDPRDGQRPFGNPIPRADVALCMLGLLPKPGAILLMQFELPKGVKPRTPTCCDAYGGGEWPVNFQPAPERAPYGSTVPTDQCPVREGRPEVVHTVTHMDSLVNPVEYA